MMNRICRIFLGGLFALGALQGCFMHTGGSMAVSIRDLSDRTWFLIEMSVPDRYPLPENYNITLAVEGDSSVSGVSGCNSYRGRINRLDAGSIQLSELAVTRMGCTEDRMHLEETFLGTIGKAATYVLFADTLVLLDSAHSTMLRFTSQPGTVTVPRQNAPVRGYLRMVDGKLVFKKLGQDREFAVKDLTGELSTILASLTSQPGESAFVALDATTDEGPTSSPSGQGNLTVHEILQAMPPEASPQLDLLQNLVFLARGNEPFWAVRISSDSITLIQPDTTQVAFPLGSPTYSDTLWLFEARSSGIPSQGIRVAIHRGRCIDGMSGAYSGFRATVTLQDRILTGCAVRGDVSF